jgi:hypothetical protein
VSEPVPITKAADDQRRQRVLELVLTAMAQGFNGCLEIHFKDGRPLQTKRIEVQHLGRDGD